MRISRISLTNFRQYRKAEFSFPKGRNDVHVIIGQNGVGKTTLYNALNWCLYEEEPRSYSANSVLPIVNMNTIDETPEGEAVDVVVEVVFEDESKRKQYTFRRTGTYIIEGKNVRKYNIEFDAVLTENGNSESIEREAARRQLSKVIPKEIREFFFFDGEKLDNYFSDKQSNERIYSAVFSISQVEVLDVIVRRLKDLIEEQNRIASKNSPNLELLNGQIEKQKKQLHNLENSITETRKNIDEAKKKLNEYHEYLKNLPEIAVKEDERSRLQQERINVQANIDQYETDLRNLIREYSIILLASKALLSFFRDISEKKRNNELPPHVDRNLLEQMLQVNKCKICDRELDETAKNHISSVLEQIRLGSELAGLLLQADVAVQSNLNRIDEYLYKRDRILEPLTRNKKMLEEIERKVQEIDTLLASYSNKTDIVKKQIERKQIETLLKKLTIDLKLHESNYQRTEIELEDSNKKWEEISKKVKKLEQIRRRIGFLKKAHDRLESIESTLMERNRRSIQAFTDNMFKSLIWKKDYFARVEIGEDYGLSLYNARNLSCLGSISAAERALLALSYTLALHSVSGYEPPLVIDTPVSRISDKNRMSFGKVLIDVGQKKQIILLFTPAEYSQEIETEMKPYLSSFRKLQLVNGQEISII